MKDASYIRTHINVQAVNESKFDVVAYQVGRACERVLAAAQRDPFYFSGDVEIYVSIGPPSPAPKEATMAAETPAAPLEKAVEQARDALATVAMRYPNGWGGYDTLSVCTSALTALLAALDADKRLERAEDLLRSASRHLFRDAPMSMAIHDYFARREEKNGGDRG